MESDQVFGGERWPGEGTPHGFSEPQMRVLASLCEVLIPAIETDKQTFPGSPKKVNSKAKAFYLASGAEPPLPSEVAQRIRKLPGEAIFLMRTVIWALSTRLGTLLLCGLACMSLKFPFVNRFFEIPLPQREKILQTWSQESFFWPLRMFFILVKLLTFYNFFTRCDDRMKNPFWEAIGYRLPQQEGSRSTPRGERPLDKGLVQMRKESDASFMESLKRKGFTVFADEKEAMMNVECDVVIVGSGCGGGVAAAVLARAGRRVIILEKGDYFVAEDYTGNEGPSTEKLYEEGGILSTVDGSTMILAGSTVGGGSAINWGACIKTPAHVMAEWAQSCRLPLFGSPEYLSAMDYVCQRIGVTENCQEESLQNRLFVRGCNLLGLNVERVPRNSPEDHFCGSCSFGCPTGKKHGTDTTWLVDAVDSGAVVLTNCQAERFLLKNEKNGNKKKRCVGVSARAVAGKIRKQLRFHAKVSVSSAGALRTPVLLAASGLKNRHIGKNLHLHPALMAWGYFPEEKGNMYEGGVITEMHKVVEEDGGWTAIIEAVMLGPGGFSVAMPWVNGGDMKERMSRYSKTAHLAVLARDRSSSGEVGRRIKYNLDNRDKEALRQGLRQALRILVAAGAAEVGTHRSDGQRIKCEGVKDKDLEEFLDGVGLPAGPKSGGRSWVLGGSGHQMGSCRMGAGPDEGAVDEDGESWDAEGLFVFDASVFPTALGVNPMITIQSISLCLSQRLAKSMAALKDDTLRTVKA